MMYTRGITTIGLTGGFLAMLLSAGCVTRTRTVYVERQPPVVVQAPPPGSVIVVEPPPPDVVEVIPAPQPGYVWIGGHYFYDGRRYFWEPGRYVLPPRHSAYWEPGHWARPRWVYLDWREMALI